MTLILLALSVAWATLPCMDDEPPELVFPAPRANNVSPHTALYVERGSNIDIELLGPDGRAIPLQSYFGYSTGHCDNHPMMLVPQEKIAPNTRYTVRMWGGFAIDGDAPFDVRSSFTTGASTEAPPKPAVNIGGTWEDTYEGPEVLVHAATDGVIPMYTMVGDGTRWVAAHGTVVRSGGGPHACVDVRAFDQAGREAATACLCQEERAAPAPTELHITADPEIEAVAGAHVADIEACVTEFQALPCGSLRPLGARTLRVDTRGGTVASYAGFDDLGLCIAGKALAWPLPDGRFEATYAWREPPPPPPPEPEPEEQAGCGCHTGGGLALLFLPLLGWRRR